MKTYFNNVLLFQFIFLLSFVLIFQPVQSWQDETKDNKLFEKYISSGNDTLSRALDDERGGNILHIKVALVITKMTFNEPDQATLHLILVQQWHDTRLQFSSNDGISTIRLTKKSSKRIWLPSTYFAYALNQTTDQEALEHDKTTVTNSGDICSQKNLVVKISCQTDFTFYPVDQQKCTLLLKSKEFNSLTVYNVTGFKKGVWSVDSISMADMRLDGFNRKLDNKRYSRNALEVLISRRPLLFYLTRFYLPAFLVVVAAFFPLYMSPTVHYKVLVGVAATLIMVTLVYSTSPPLPKMNLLTALDVYHLFCLFSVFLAILEYSIIGFFDTKVVKQANREDNGDHKVGKRVFTVKKSGWKVKAAYVVHYAVGKLYPFFFVLFHVLYGVVFLAIVLYQKYSVEIRHPTAMLDDIC